MNYGDIPGWISALANVALACIAFRQLPALAEQIRLSRDAAKDAERRTREWETLKACEHYDLDPVLDDVCKRIWAASKNGTDYSSSSVDRRDVICVLNYFDGLATGIEQGLYIEAVVKDHLGAVIDHAVKIFIDGGIIDRSNLDKLLAVHTRWYRSSSPTDYKSRPA